MGEHAQIDPKNGKSNNNTKVRYLETENNKAQRARAVSLPVPVEAVKEKGCLLLQRKLKGFFDQSDDALFELADRAMSNQEQNVYFDSMREVRVQRSGIEKRFALAINEAFACLASSAGDDARNVDTTLAQETLSLVNNDDLEEMVAMDSAISRANDQFGEAIQQISLRLDSLLPLKVYQKNNPFGPYVIYSAFVKQTNGLDIDIKAKLVLFKLFDKHVASHLGGIYSVVNNLFVDHNILPSLTAANVHRYADGSPAQASVASTQFGQGSEEIAEVLGKLLGKKYASLEPSVSGSAKELIELLSMAQRLPVDNYDLAEGNASANNIDLESVLSQLRSQQGKEAQIGRLDTEVMKLVSMLFDFILEDRNLAEPMKALLGRMQIPIVKVALADKTFFTQGSHPARQLLNQMSSAALGWEGDSDSANKDALYKKISQIVYRLIEDFDHDISIFGELLAEFTSFLDKEKRRVDMLERRTLDAEDGKAKAEVARQIVAAEIELRTIHRELPEVVLALIQDGWRNVLFVTGLKYGYSSTQWQEALSTLDMLVGSVLIPKTEMHRKALIGMVPGLLKKLRIGLDTISFSPFEMAELFKALEAVHLRCIRDEPEAAVVIKPTPERPPVSPFAGDAPTPNTEASEQSISEHSIIKPAPEVAKSVPGVAEPISKVAEPESKIVKPALEVAEAQVTDDAPVLPEASDVYMRRVAHFVQGAWFEVALNEDEDTLSRCRLAAYIKPTGKYIFVNRGGVKVAEKTQQELALLLQRSKIRPLDNSVLFDRALETVVACLRDN